MLTGVYEEGFGGASNVLYFSLSSGYKEVNIFKNLCTIKIFDLYIWVIATRQFKKSCFTHQYILNWICICVFDKVVLRLSRCNLIRHNHVWVLYMINYNEITFIDLSLALPNIHISFQPNWIAHHSLNVSSFSLLFFAHILFILIFCELNHILNEARVSFWRESNLVRPFAKWRLSNSHYTIYFSEKPRFSYIELVQNENHVIQKQSRIIASKS